LAIAVATPATAGDLLRRDDGARHDVRVDAAVLDAEPETLALELVPGERRWALRSGIERTAGGGVVWRGRFADAEPGYTSVTLSLHGGHLNGFVETEQGSFVLRAGADGRGRLTPAFDHSEPRCGVGPAAVRSGAAATASAAANWWQLAPATADDPAELGILFVYRPQVAEHLGGEAATVAAARAMIDALNTTLTNSAIHARAYFAGARPLDAGSWLWVGSVPTVLSQAVNDATIAALRDETGGDIVSLWLEPDFPGGCTVAYGYLMGNGLVGPQMAARAFNAGCYTGHPLTFVHEVGHNLGAHHSPGTAGPPEANSFPWSYAYQCCDDAVRFSTVMTSGQRVNQFSNPDLVLTGVPAGIPDQIDNARTLNLTAPIAEAFRPGTPPTGEPEPPRAKPAKPTKLTAKALGGDQLELAWRDVAVNEDVYLLERKVGKQFVEVMAVGAGVRNVIFFLTPPAPGKVVLFRLRARNAAGFSPYSNVARLKMPQQ
jgi:hypothetical protein